MVGKIVSIPVFSICHEADGNMAQARIIFVALFWFTLAHHPILAFQTVYIAKF